MSPDPSRERHFEELYRRYEHRVAAYALRRAPDQLAMDAVADTFLAAWRRLDELPKDPLPWLIEAARKNLGNHRRAAARQSNVERRLAHDRLTQVSVQAGVGSSVVKEALSQLRADERETLLMVAWDGLTPAQAARSLGCSAVAFRVRLHRARGRFAIALDRAKEAASAPQQRPTNRQVERRSLDVET